MWKSRTLEETTEIPQVDNGKMPWESMNVVHFPILPSNTPYGNMLLKGTDIVRRMDRVNKEIYRVYTSYVHPTEHDIYNRSQDLLEHQFYAEQVTYWLRKTADELISLAFVIDEWSRSGSWPDVIKIDSIGSLNDKVPERLEQLFLPHKFFLSVLNEVTNAFKHSFINTDMTLLGPEYPVVFALSLKRNKLTGESKFYSIDFRDIVEHFSIFYKDSIETVQDWSKSSTSA
ncbi:MAG: hypothetical protein AAF716_08465 [Cyanobacteria bacterium P01_D01_bin.1]